MTPEPLKAILGETFLIRDDERAVGGRSICCLVCGFTSYNPNDVTEHWCCRCYAFHDRGAPELRVGVVSPELARLKN